MELANYFFPPHPMMNQDMLRLFSEGRLQPQEPAHNLYIRARLAALAVEDPAGCKTFTALYEGKGLGMKVKVTEEPVEAPVVQPAEVEVPVEPLSKKQIMAKLNEAGIEYDPTQKKSDLLALLPSA
jgi:hypothetical protein